MHTARGFRKHLPGFSRSISRREVVAGTARVTVGSVLAALTVRHSMQRAVAQDDTVTLAGAASEVSARPGAAAATAAAQEAVAERGAARVQAAAALAHGDSEDGATTQSPVAAAIANPDEGAIAQGALAVAEAVTGDGESSPAYGGRAPRSRGRKIRGRGKKAKVKKLPATGSGPGPLSLSSLLAAGAVLAAGGAAASRVCATPDAVPASTADH